MRMVPRETMLRYPVPEFFEISGHFCVVDRGGSFYGKRDF